MTSEVCLMNRHAIALAADSATTVTQWIDGKKEERFFKGANKIFQMSNHHPVGMMIYDTADLQRMPWEVIVKEFRTALGDRSFNSVDGYAQEFCDFVANHAHLYPADYQVSVFKEQADSAAIQYLIAVTKYDAFVHAADDAEKGAAAQAFINGHLAQVDAEAFSGYFRQEDLDGALAAHKAEILLEVEKSVSAIGLAGLVNSEIVTELAIKALLKRYHQCMAKTGVVIAGFGDHDYLPSQHEYDCFGLLLGKFLFDKKDTAVVTYTNPASIKAFATTGMVNTFALGFSPDILQSIEDGIGTALEGFAEEIRARLGAAGVPDLDGLIRQTTENFMSEWTNAALKRHGWPLRRIIGNLSVDEMAELAETLIMLQSLKEKVTQPTESVSGPIDVAVITKGDGFVWIKRKHYFDPKLNPRFFLRQGANYRA